MCGDPRCPQTLAEMCRNMGICYGFRSKAARVKYPCNSNHLHDQSLSTQWGQMTHICVSKFTIIVSDNGLSPVGRQAIIWNNAGILSIGLLGTNFSEIFIEILTFSFTKMRLKVSSAKWRPFCLGLNVLIHTISMASHYQLIEGQVRHICVSEITIIGSDNGLSPD